MQVILTEQELKFKLQEAFIKGKMEAITFIHEEIKPYFKSVDGLFLKNIINEEKTSVAKELKIHQTKHL